MALTLMLRPAEFAGKVRGEYLWSAYVRDAVDAASGERAGREAVDDATAAAGGHGGHDCLCAEQGSSEVDVDDAVPLFGGHVREAETWEVGHDRGVVHQDVSAAERFGRGGSHCLGRFGSGDVDGDADRARPAVGCELLSGTLRGLRVDIGEHDRGADLDEGLAVDRADATGAAGDDRDLSREVEQCVGSHVALLVLVAMVLGTLPYWTTLSQVS